jgi:hypothetical protein
LISNRQDAEGLLEQIKPQLIDAFSNRPEFGALGFTVHFYERQAVRVEWTGSSSRILAPKRSRRVQDAR